MDVVQKGSVKGVYSLHVNCIWMSVREKRGHFGNPTVQKLASKHITQNFISRIFI